MSWWSLGEGSGFPGDDLALYKITCPFCLERGNFGTATHAEMKKPNSKKRLNFDTLECGNCKGYVMVLWSASEHGPRQGMHNFEVLPWPQKLDSFPDYLPEPVGRCWLQAKRNIKDENWDAAALMARSSLQVALRGQGAKKGSLKSEIDDLASMGILPPNIKDWSNEVRELGNESAHPAPEADPTSPDDARDVVRFLDFLLEYLYGLPHRINQYRTRLDD